MPCEGFEIVCPDGKTRHPPYHAHGDADLDARYYTEKGCGVSRWDAIKAGDARGKCPQGKHSVRATTFTHAEHP